MAVIKEEFVALTGDLESAVILNQFLYWQERTRDTDAFVYEESERLSIIGIESRLEPTYGWVYKSTEQLLEETMLPISQQTARRRIRGLVDNGWLMERKNPNHAWDKTLQYRIDTVKLQGDLNQIGYSLSGYTQNPRHYAFSKMENRDSSLDDRSSTLENRSSTMEEQYQRLLTETTTEITPEIKKSMHSTEQSSDLILGDVSNTQLDDVKTIAVAYQNVFGISPKTKDVVNWVRDYGFVLVMDTLLLTQQENPESPEGWFRSALRGDYVRQRKTQNGGKQRGYHNKRHPRTNSSYPTSKARERLRNVTGAF